MSAKSRGLDSRKHVVPSLSRDAAIYSTKILIRILTQKRKRLSHALNIVVIMWCDRRREGVINRCFAPWHHDVRLEVATDGGIAHQFVKFKVDVKP